MKKVIVASFLVFAGLSSQAQKLEIIPKAGINISKQTIEGISNEKVKVGFQGGVGFNVSTGLGAFSVQPELNFLNKGTKVKVAGGNADLKLNYLEVPLLAKYSFGPVYVNAGPSLGLLLDKESKVRNQYGEKLKKLDFGVQMGAGLAIPAGPGKVIVDGRYNLGLSNLGKVNDIKNRGIMASLGYAIPF